MDVKSELEDGPLELVDINGIPLFTDTAEIWDLLSAFKARPDDLLICTFPKAGTTWIQEIADMIQHGGESQKIPMYKRMPFIEINYPLISGLKEANIMPSPRMLKSHLPVQLLPNSFWEQNCKIIYVARNAKDNAVSYFHFHRMNRGMPDPGTWEEFLEKFLSGNVVWGSWFDHVRGWWEAKDCHQILYLFYEDMKEDLEREVRKVAQFMGYELSESVLNKIVQQTKFERMKENPMANYTTLPTCDQTVSPFMRKGMVGDWKEKFTAAQSERFDEACSRLLAGSGLSFRMQL